MGTSEDVLGNLGWQARGLSVHTKLLPTAVMGGAAEILDGIGLVHHSPEDMRKHLQNSLKALNTDSADLWYLHAPDRTIPYEITLKAANELYEEGLFKRLGISNYAAWEVAEIVSICRANGYIQPTVYQGIYNVLYRGVEPELFTCLRKFGISFYGFSALGGGFFTGRFASKDDKPEAGTRFDPSTTLGKHARARYWNDHYFKAMDIIRPVADKYSLTPAEIALRWISHHSKMKQEFGDSVIIGASSSQQTEQNLIDLEKGPLPDEVIQALDAAWLVSQPYATIYFWKF